MNTIDLLKEAKMNNESAKNKIIEKYLPLIKSQIGKYKHIEGYDYEDLFQYGILSVLKAINIFDINKSSSFGGYLKWTIVNNFSYLCRKENNQKKKTSSLNVVTDEGFEIIEMLEDPETIEKIYMERVEVQRILDAIEKLEEDQKNLCKIIIQEEGKSNLKEIAKKLGVPYHRIVYKRKILAKKLKNILMEI